jgi:hypothetical protein
MDARVRMSMYFSFAALICSAINLCLVFMRIW